MFKYHSLSTDLWIDESINQWIMNPRLMNNAWRYGPEILISLFMLLHHQKRDLRSFQNFKSYLKGDSGGPLMSVSKGKYYLASQDWCPYSMNSMKLWLISQVRFQVFSFWVSLSGRCRRLRHASSDRIGIRVRRPQWVAGFHENFCLPWFPPSECRPVVWSGMKWKLKPRVRLKVYVFGVTVPQRCRAS